MLGLKRICRSKTASTQSGVIVPNEIHNPTGLLYRLVGNAATANSSLGGLEEPLNDVFDLTKAIASDEIRRRRLFAPRTSRNERVNGDIAKHIEVYKDLFAGLSIAVVSRCAVRMQLDGWALAHSGISSGDATVRRVVIGSTEQIKAHDGSEC